LSFTLALYDIVGRYILIRIKKYKKAVNMRIEVIEVKTKEDKIYLELLEQYRINQEVQSLMNEDIFPSELILMGDFRLIKMLDFAIMADDIKVYLVKEVDNDIFAWVIGKFLSDEKIQMYPLLKEQSKELQLEIRRALIEKGLFKSSDYLESL